MAIRLGLGIRWCVQIGASGLRGTDARALRPGLQRDRRRAHRRVAGQTVSVPRPAAARPNLLHRDRGQGGPPAVRVLCGLVRGLRPPQRGLPGPARRGGVVLPSHRREGQRLVQRPGAAVRHAVILARGPTCPSSAAELRGQSYRRPRHRANHTLRPTATQNGWYLAPVSAVWGELPGVLVSRWNGRIIYIHCGEEFMDQSGPRIKIRHGPHIVKFSERVPIQCKRMGSNKRFSIVLCCGRQDVCRTRIESPLFRTSQ